MKTILKAVKKRTGKLITKRKLVEECCPSQFEYKDYIGCDNAIYKVGVCLHCWTRPEKAVDEKVQEPFVFRAEKIESQTGTCMTCYHYNKNSWQTPCRECENNDGDSYKWEADPDAK